MRITPRGDRDRRSLAENLAARAATIAEQDTHRPSRIVGCGRDWGPTRTVTGMGGTIVVALHACDLPLSHADPCRCACGLPDLGPDE